MDEVHLPDSDDGRAGVRIGDIKGDIRGTIIAGRDIGYSPEQFVAMVNSMMTLMYDIPQARNRLRGTKTILENTRTQLRRLAEYKEIHELLQRLESSYLIVHAWIHDNERLLPIEQVRWPGLAKSCFELQNNIDKLCTVMAKALFAADVADWRKVLVCARVKLQTAYGARCLDRFDDAINDISWVISTQTSRMNDRLVEAADGLRLAELINFFEDMHTELTQSRASLETALAQRLDSFRDDVNKLARLAEQFTMLRNDHDRWQQITNDLRQEGARLSANLSGFHTRWRRRLKNRLERLYAGLQDEWARDLSMQVTQLESELEGQKADAVLQAFEECWRSIMHRFNQVDYDFYRLCNVLKEAGGPLNALVEEWP